MLPTLLQLQAHECVDEMSADANRVELDATVGITASIFGAATWEGHPVNLTLDAI